MHESCLCTLASGSLVAAAISPEYSQQGVGSISEIQNKLCFLLVLLYVLVMNNYFLTSSMMYAGQSIMHENKTGQATLRVVAWRNLCVSTIRIFTGTPCTVTGWGRTRQGGTTSRVLREAMVPIISDAKCKQNYRPDLITSNMLCAGFSGGGIDACQGDSGGNVHNPSTQENNLM